ncbi:MAG: PQQ-binding-like beta-propeller repeat protein, partial [candidate division Zixibacteria bacterium]|nr:PQQ-binding-like beta-propeller repeat protein [candidate division Zixibacteria bacterium]
MSKLSQNGFARTLLICFGVVLYLCACSKPSFELNNEISQWPFARKNIAGNTAIQNASFDGKLDIVWERGIGEHPQGPLTLSRGALLYAGSKKRVFLIDPSSGNTIKKIKGKSPPQTGGVIIDSLFYRASAPPYNRVECIRVVDWKRVWRGLIFDISAPLVFKDEKMFLCGGDGIFYCLNRFSGDLIWEYETNSKLSSAPVISVSDTGAGGIVILAANDGNLISLNYETGEHRKTIWIDTAILASPVVDVEGGYVYLSTYSGLCKRISLDELTGLASAPDSSVVLVDSAASHDAIDYKMDYRMVAGSWSSPVVGGGRVVFCDIAGGVYAFDEASLDAPLWKANLGGTLISSPIIVGEMVILGT